jgi:hypothetical protein
MKYFVLFALSLAAVGSNVSTARAADCGGDAAMCYAGCGSYWPWATAVCSYNCSVEYKYCKANPNNQ